MASQYQDFTLTGEDQGGNAISVAFKILNNVSPEDSISANSKRRTIQYQIDFRDFGKAQLLLIGWPSTTTTPTGKLAMSRSIPHSYTDPNGAFLYCTGVTRAVGIQPKRLTKATDDPYQYLHITCVYEILPYLIVEDDDLLDETGGLVEVGTDLYRFVELGEVSSTSKVYRQMFGAFCYCHRRTDPGDSGAPAAVQLFDGGIPYIIETQRPVAQGVPFEYREQVVELVWHHVPRDNAPLQIAFAMQNTINNADFYIWKRHTAMLDAIKPEFSLEVDGTYSWKIRYRFRINTNGQTVSPSGMVTGGGGWLFLPDPQNSNQWTRVASIAANTALRPNNSGAPLYQDNDFNLLFTPIASP